MSREPTMRSIELKNPEVRAALDAYLTLWQDTDYRNDLRLDGQEHASSTFVNDQYRDEIINKGTNHLGFPEVAKMYNLKPDLMDVKKSFVNKSESAVVVKDKWIQRYNKINNHMAWTVGARHNALCALYPPGGFIGWHNNANASAYNIICTWSETGDGYWMHRDPVTKENVKVPDPKGWSIKAFYFGSYDDDPENLVYHTATTNCWRMTVSFVFNRDSKDYWIDCLDNIEYDGD